ncbi:MAG: hypothetical protein B7Y08_29730 [Rhodospirillales bacterium 24-66-33]|jgi:hypothetical protein|uniref:hypothetical protein n=1 Tax=Reyranella sp. TaxID=1929291 RepID=UPI000BD44C5E|nr:hypothetical protein [Reyranella sp.]OYY33111.1 MAG: hypothetical protein B7Y57_29755 [Rhodospirillales bacterium 35-66-84]OYZ90482.1 MAG: hypothetical protein B7Y08_29730 [Rhodospirillales bacterium 24-66-33]OZB20807.1 MAG: hypothetical protein B7X63_29810 [Rhodospirillales bacterium 39-66-50]HQT15756.1 hypothetical protein [Reyranella sp.]
MSEERTYGVAVIAETLERHLRDAKAMRGTPWMAEVVDLLMREAAFVPAPVQRTDTIPTYLYPH